MFTNLRKRTYKICFIFKKIFFFIFIIVLSQLYHIRSHFVLIHQTENEFAPFYVDYLSLPLYRFAFTKQFQMSPIGSISSPSISLDWVPFSFEQGWGGPYPLYVGIWVKVVGCRTPFFIDTLQSSVIFGLCFSPFFRHHLGGSRFSSFLRAHPISRSSFFNDVF